MTNSQYKTKTLVGLDPVSPAIGGLAPYTRARWTPLRALFAAQDTIPATSRRTVAEWSLSGSAQWAQPAGTVNPNPASGNVYPRAVWRELGHYRTHVTPGCELRAHVLFCPAGLVQKADDTNDGAWAELRVGVTWTNGGSSSGPHYHGITMQGSGLGTYGGSAPSTDGGNWAALDEREIVEIRPPGFDTTPATAAIYSEWTDAEIVVQVRGGARVVHVSIYEVPLAHATFHTNAGLTSVHAMPPGLQPATSRPAAKAPDGVTYEEHRFGTRRMAQVAERQSERLGPRILSWSSWNESTINAVTATENAPVTITSASFLDLTDTSISTYAVTNPGFVAAGSHAQLQRLAGPYIAGGRFGVVPVRVRVEASQSTGTGTVRVQTRRGYIDVQVTGARGWYTATGHLESQVFADHNAPPLALRGSANNGARTLSVWNVSIDFGWW